MKAFGEGCPKLSNTKYRKSSWRPGEIETPHAKATRAPEQPSAGRRQLHQPNSYGGSSAQHQQHLARLKEKLKKKSTQNDPRGEWTPNKEEKVKELDSKLQTVQQLHAETVWQRERSKLTKQKRQQVPVVQTPVASSINSVEERAPKEEKAPKRNNLAKWKEQMQTPNLQSTKQLKSPVTSSTNLEEKPPKRNALAKWKEQMQMSNPQGVKLANTYAHPKRDRQTNFRPLAAGEQPRSQVDDEDQAAT